ncbi:MAG: hypothetical protein ABL903_14355 [Methylococcales bacterium]
MLESFSAAPILFGAAVRFDAGSNLLTVPLVEAVGQSYIWAMMCLLYKR